MGDTAVDTPEERLTAGENDVVKGDDPKDGDVTPEGEGPEASEETPEVEVVLQGVDGSQPSVRKPNGFQKRIGKLNEQKAAFKEQADQSSVELQTEREKNKLLQLALAQKTENEAVKPPDPNNFDDGLADPRYIEANQTYNQSYIDAQVEQRIARIQVPQGELATDPELLRLQSKHFDEAEKLGADDYEETEDTVIAEIGTEAVNAIIKSSEKSHLILYYLGKNPDELASIKHLIATNPAKALLQIGRLEVGLKVQPKANSQHTPDPDEELKGGSPSAGNSKERRVAKQLDQMRQDVSGGTKTFADLIAFKKQAKADGVTL